VIDPIAKLHSPAGSLLSVYVNRRSPGTRAALVDLLKAIRNSHLGPQVAKSSRVDGGRILDLASSIETGAAPAVAIFASHRDGIFEFLPLAHRVEDTATIAPRPYLRPLRAQARPMRVGVLVADSSRARTYLMAGGDLHEHGDELVVDRGKDNYGGFAGYEEHHNRARADEASSHLWRQAGRRLLEAHQDQPLELVVIAGHDTDFDSIGAELHTYLRQLPQGRITIDIRNLVPTELAELVAEQVEAQRVHRSEQLLERLLMEVARGGAGVTGLSGVLEACNAHAVDHLVVAGPFAKPGAICDGCGWLGRSGASCPVCSASTFPADDVVAAAMDATVEAGGRADIVTVASPLDANGVGALLRFRLG
jgi:peptide chain release factor subunit 1